VDRKIDTMCKALHDLGDRTCSEALPQLEAETFVSLSEAVSSDDADSAETADSAGPGVEKH